MYDVNTYQREILIYKFLYIISFPKYLKKYVDYLIIIYTPQWFADPFL